MDILRYSVLATAGLFFAVYSVYGQGQPYYVQQPETRAAGSSDVPGTLAQPILQRPIQTPPKRVYQNGAVAGQTGRSQTAQPVDAAGFDGRTLPPGYGAPFPTGLPVHGGQAPSANGYKVAAAPVDPNRQNVPLYGVPGTSSVPQPQLATVNPITGQQYVPPAPAASIPAAHPPVPQPSADNEQRKPPVYVGSSAPENRVIPFLLSPEEQGELDEFLTRWEKYSEGIKRYDVDFNIFLYNAAIPGQDLTKPYKTAFGFFKYIAKPMRFVYSVEGEWVGDERVKRNDDPKTANVYAEKIIINEESVFKYDYNAKNVLQINVPPEIIGRGIADSPLPLIFGAKAADMKRRFSMKIRMVEQNNTPLIFLQAKPLLVEDQQEFALVELLLEKNTFRAKGLKRYDINGKTFTVYELHSPVINGNLSTILSDIKTYFTPSVPRGWKHEINDWAADVQMAKREQPGTLPAGIAPSITEQRMEQRNEIQLYSPK